ncbi:glycosyltransferase family 2 protein [Pelagivirga sediminicola]|uniref:Glycosyltransferase family 2 protein n=1 Tax=Pelagivirga sediminicola TaxID=2170575 RepID=A0A2T7GBR0_9RHOB|nr:glycosyltransferase family 2 protein [Pelagivirga sediminicola]PVA11857.1 glycosyltransferase family 2 protein [Pelagivirga sediminicola]
MNHATTWGLVSTIKAPAQAILNFAAHHLDIGAHRIHVFLDEDCPPARHALAAHPRCSVTVTDDAYRAKRRKRPDAHQARQTVNATRAYRRRPGVEWLGHIDVDEFLDPSVPLAEQLGALPAAARTARIRPIEALAPLPGDENDGGTWFKACHPRQSPRNAQTQEIYPTYGALLNGGFLSHVAGKIFVRTGQEGVSLRIHNAFDDGGKIENEHELTQTRLCHFHAPGWQDWQQSYRYRLQSGSYREGLKGAASLPMTMNALFRAIEADGGEPALRAFFDEVCTATPAFRARLDAHGLLHRADLDLDAKRARHFPDAA